MANGADDQQGSARRARDPYLNLLFRLSVAGKTWLEFSECSGLSLETGTEEYAEGGENRFAYVFPSRAKPPPLVLKRGLTTTRKVWEWYVQFVEEGKVEPRDGQVELYGSPDFDQDPVRVWAFTRGYPVKWTGPELNAMSPGVAFETVELVHLGLRIRE